MAFELTENLRSLADSNAKQPQMVLEIDGVSTVYGVRTIQKYVQIGDTDLEIGDPESNANAFYIGGLNDVEDQSAYISLAGSTTKITQQLNIDRGAGGSTSKIKISLVDKSAAITQLISPGEIITDILGTRVKLYYGFVGGAWKDDFILVFRGFITDVDAGSGLVTIKCQHPDTKKDSDIFIPAETELTAGITSGSSSLPVTSTTNFLTSVNGPDGTVDSALSFYVKIENEIIKYESTTSTSFGTLTRGALGTTAAAHDSGTEVKSFYRLQGDAMDLALKLMLSGVNGPFAEDVAVTNFVRVSSSETVSNSIFFFGVDVETEYGIVVGDYITTTGATDAANNVTLKTISDIVQTNDGSYIVISGVTFVEENETSAVIDFRSQYDTLGEGLGMYGDEVDVAEHERIQRLFLSSFNYDFYLEDEINGKDFIEEELFVPAAAFSIPRKAKASVGYHIGPLPTTDIKKLNLDTVLNPADLTIRRTIGRNFANTILYKYERDVLTDKLLKVKKVSDATSLTRIPVGTKPLTIEAHGMRSSINADNLAQTAADRKLKRYKFGAEYIDGVKVTLKTGFNLEIGDKVLLELSDLKISDIQQASRSGKPRLFEVINRDLDLRGDVVVDLIDTNFSVDARYGLISPSSKIRFGYSGTEFEIEETGNSRYGTNEYKKWENYIGAKVRVRNPDWTTSATATLQALTNNRVTLDSALGFTPASDSTYRMELAGYTGQTDTVKLIFAFMSDSTFPDGGIQYQML